LSGFIEADIRHNAENGQHGLGAAVTLQRSIARRSKTITWGRRKNGRGCVKSQTQLYGEYTSDPIAELPAA
jgi:hypothetical protein